ncbi:MAG TPA: GTP-binding protein, partial [Terriglobia bacterium]|nr:GTP-binding protein [Terriglobia bacterium]
MLRFITAGSVDDGKSTLIGRLLVDARGAFEDQVSAATRDNERRGGKGIDFSLLTDGLKAEREQGITIDVAYRYFATDRRKFIIADAPGHEQYTRNMVTAASKVDLALILVDARAGLVTQSRRHAFIAHLLGIRHFIIAVNKMDLVEYSRETYERIVAEFTEFFSRLDPVDLRFVPISALLGDMVVERGDSLGWYDGPTVMELLETIEIERQDASHLRFPVQLVNRPPMAELGDFRGYMGQIASGQIHVGQPVTILPAGRRTQVTGIVTFDGDLEAAFAPQSITLTLAEDLDVARGDMIVDNEDAPEPRTAFNAVICWMSGKPMRPGRKYGLRHTTRRVKAMVGAIDYRIDPNTLERGAGIEELRQNDIARVSIKTLQPIVCDPYRVN